MDPLKPLIGLFFAAFATALFASPLIDDSDPYPYQDLASTSFAANQPALSLKTKIRSKGGISHLEAEITLYNNTTQNIQVVESNVFVDFQFDVRDQSNEVVLPNSVLDTIKAKRDAFIHSDQVFSPGQGRKYFINLSKIYGFVSGKTYQVTVSRTVQGSVTGVLKLTSTSVQFTMP
jgi:hypothetical protein